MLPQVFLPTQACQCSPTDQRLVFILTFVCFFFSWMFDEMSELSLQLSVGSSWSACFATNQTIREMRSTGNPKTYCSTLMKPFSWVIKHSYEIICESFCVLLKRTSISDSIFKNLAVQLWLWNVCKYKQLEGCYKITKVLFIRQKPTATEY